MAEKCRQLLTVWGREFDKEKVLTEYPRPRMKRKSYVNLNGEWDYAFSPNDIGGPDDVLWNGKIIVPYSPESFLSGVSRQLKPDEILWYRRTVELPSGYNDNSRLLLHFGAVDQRCLVYINRRKAGRYTGGYLPFTVDLTELVHPSDKSVEIILAVRDSTERSYHARGKQLLNRGGMFYTAQSGIWQSVWMECTPLRYIKKYRIDPDPETGAVHMEILMNLSISEVADPADILKTTRSHKFESISNRMKFTSEKKVKLYVKQSYTDPAAGLDASVCRSSEKDLTEECLSALGDKDYWILDGMGIADIRLNVERISFRNNRIFIDLHVPDRRLWSPSEPNLYYFRLRVFSDEVSGYFAFRSISIGRKYGEPDAHPRICLNDAPYFQKGVLDQGYWPEGLYTPPSDRAFLYDILKMKELGFNMLRKHLKIEPERYYYHCDRTGMLVWQDMVNGGGQYKFWLVTYLPTVFNMFRYRLFDNCYKLLARGSKKGRLEFEREVKATVRLLYDHPSIVTWVIFNEGWGQFDAKRLTKEVKMIDRTRPVDSTSGWFDQECGDIRSQHYYFLKLRVQWCRHRATAISEFGGFPLRIEDHSMYDKIYGYHNCKDHDELRARYSRLMSGTIEPKIDQGLSATVYTQLSDVEEEVNGILTYDREICKLEDV
ncbi:MAG: glycoside hydrolase family 2 [Lachnospiraceae bacterium]|nr:glycoside hydrolase family 2 [Lachnospiraceae bacterium]